MCPPPTNSDLDSQCSWIALGGGGCQHCCWFSVYRMLWTDCFVSPKGEQNIPPQNVLFWHSDSFEPKAVETQQTQEKLFTSPLTAKKNLDLGPVP